MTNAIISIYLLPSGDWTLANKTCKDRGPTKWLGNTANEKLTGPQKPPDYLRGLNRATCKTLQ